MWPVLQPLLIQGPDVYPLIEDAMRLTNSWEYVSKRRMWLIDIY